MIGVRVQLLVYLKFWTGFLDAVVKVIEQLMQHFFPLQIRSIHACMTYIVTILFRAPSQLLRLVVCMRLYVITHVVSQCLLINNYFLHTKL